MILRRNARPTLTAVEMIHGEKLEFVLRTGTCLTIELVDTKAEIVQTDLEEPGKEEPGAMTVYRFWADLRIDGVDVGVAEHSHFGFAVLDHGELIRLDPWILFWQMYRDRAANEPAGGDV